jgi:plasmid stability protein
MVTALDLPQDLVDDIQQRAAQEGRGIDETAAELLRAGLAASSHATAINVDPRMLERRKAIVQKFLSGEWGTEFQGFEEGRAADRKSAEARNKTWRR